MSPPAEGSFPLGRLRVGAVIAVALAAGLLVWLLVRDGDSGKDAGEPAKAVSIEKLKALPGEVGHDVYWAGPRRGYTYETTQTAGGETYIRYLPPGVRVGDSRPNFLTVGTYPHRNAFATVQKGSRRGTAFKRSLPGGGLAFARRDIRRTPRNEESSVYFAYRGSNFLQEVYDRSPKRVRNLVTSGRVQPIR